MITENVEVDATAFDKAAKQLTAAGFEGVAEKHVKHALRQSANVVRKNVRARAARHNRGRNRFAKGVHTTWKGAGMAFQLRVMASGPVAHLLIQGTKWHRIDAHKDKPMRVPTAARGFAEWVEVKGIRADPVVHLGTLDSVPAIQALVTAAGEAMLADLAAKIGASK